MTTYSLYGDYYFTPPAPCTIKVTVTAHQSYSGFSGNSPWELAVYLDDNLVNSIGGAGLGTECPVLVAVAKNQSAGQHKLVVTWHGHTYIKLDGDTTCLETIYK